MEKEDKDNNKLIIYKKYCEDKKIICITEIILLISLSFSFPLLYRNSIDHTINNEIIFSVINFFSIIPSVSAQEILENFGVGNSIEDVQQQIGGAIEGVTTGQLGCCFDKEEGLCSPNSQRIECTENDDGQYYGDSSCNINQCIMGCCLVGNQAQFTTQTRCNKLGEISGLPASFNSEVTDEYACIGLANSKDIGACVILSLDEYEKNSCKFTNKDECNKLGGEFHKDYLCSHPDLNTVCEKQKAVSCVDGKDGLYWIDSCGNRENIYDSNKERSWNNGKVLSEKESCSPTSSNSRSSSCGNCAYERGSICAPYRPGVDKGNMQGYTCRDLNCKDGLRTRKNGESWCLYDGQVGNGRDVVGSRHFRRICVNGELKTEPCADYRKEICVKEGGVGDIVKDTTNEILGKFGISLPDLSSIPGLSGLSGILGGGMGGLGLSPEEENGEDNENIQNNQDNNGEILDNFGSGNIINRLTTSSAICRPNMWEDCSGRNIATCSINPDCKTKIVYVDSDFYLLKCVPKYPPGFELGSSGIGNIASEVGSQVTSELGIDSGAFGDLGSIGGGSGAGNVCSQASETCTVIYEKKCPSGKWKCEENCNCEEMSFTLQMNELCLMQGDCGAYTNIAGKVTSQGYSISKKGKHGKKPPKLIGIDQMYSMFARGSFQAVLGGVNGGFYNQVPGLDLTSLFGIDMFGGGEGLGGVTGSDLDTGDQLENMFSGNNLGGTLGTSAAGGVAGGYAGHALIGGTLGGPIGLGVGALVAIGIMYAMGCGKREKVEITFTCKQWTPPAIGDCSFCNKDPAKPCSKYRCESLGKNCRLINENTGQDKCVTINLETGIPKISPFQEVLNKSLFKYEDISSNGFKIRTKDGECLPAFTSLVYGVKTNIPAVCRISEEATSFDEMSGGFLEGEIYGENHTTSTYLPSIESLIADEVSNSSEFSQALQNQTPYQYLLDVTGDINLYVKCQSHGGQENIQDYKINFCVKPGPDLTPPIVVATAPVNNAFVSHSVSSWNPVFFINEPVECHWGTTRPIATNLVESYNSLENNMECTTQTDLGTLFGYPCNATLPLNEIENKFYIQCRDQPWLGENSSRNIGSVFEYTLKKTETSLEIQSISPNGTIYKGAEPASIEINVITTGGLNSGESICQYKLNDNKFITFAETKSYQHKQTLNLVKGQYNVKVRCVDTAGNIAEGETDFSLELDTKFPEITRIFYSSGNLMVITDESSRCYYRNDSNEQCNFSYENSTEMLGGDAFIHQAPWDKETTYYIKCKDIWGNSGAGCSIIAKPYEIASY